MGGQAGVGEERGKEKKRLVWGSGSLVCLFSALNREALRGSRCLKQPGLMVWEEGGALHGVGALV